MTKERPSQHRPSPFRGERTDNPTDRTRALLDRLEAQVGALQDSDSFRAYLDVQARFHTYSWGNVCLILGQRPDASRVAGYRAWQSLGRQVKRGETAIRIFVPMSKKAENLETGEEERRTFFSVGHVFDIAQTDGEPLPHVEVPVLAGDEGGQLYESLAAVAQADGVAVERKSNLGAGMTETMGFYRPGEHPTIVVREASPLQMTKTLAHELSHVRHGTRTIATHRRWDRSRRIPVGHPTYLAAKANGDHSMSGTRETPEDVYGREDPQDLRDMVKARLPELQFPAGVKFCPPLPRLMRSHHIPPHDGHGGNLPSGDAMNNEFIQGDERSTYVALGQLSSWEREIAYGA